MNRRRRCDQRDSADRIIKAEQRRTGRRDEGIASWVCCTRTHARTHARTQKCEEEGASTHAQRRQRSSGHGYGEITPNPEGGGQRTIEPDGEGRPHSSNGDVALGTDSTSFYNIVAAVEEGRLHRSLDLQTTCGGEGGCDAARACLTCLSSCSASRCQPRRT
ncbi:hypothetical protein BDZ90DRAFT_148675 [Jaminaea rosea]|uniref:Uncharacterized protein n=1 Tax=Jaminaea rosea TaxID=1569628 RepID=A0A316UX20_9BASI|nr:hypothetical protein BDZ90DRAFT_148675 [Jaminaea rosea]PWN28463.1 hypothetical protein BDZ90DRAFT_148675 [Jaminaea rosea]